MNQEQLPLLSLYSSIVTELGAGDLDYLEMQRQQASVCGSFNAFSSIRGSVDNKNNMKGLYTFSGKALSRNQAELCKLMQRFIDNARFDETARIQELVSQIRVHQEQSITGNGHALAMMAASAGISATAQLNHRLSGLQAIASIKKLDDDIKSEKALESLSATLTQLHKDITQNTSQILVIGENQHLDTYQRSFAEICKRNPDKNQSQFSLPTHTSTVNEAWITNTQVNFCAKAYPTVSMDHEDSAALVILGGFLRNGFLHTHIREQGGAYGGGASQDNNIAAFRFYSYRDPRIEETLTDFDQSIQWLLSAEHANQKLEEAILGTVSSLDKSESPAGRAKRCFHADLHGRTPEARQRFRERVLGTTMADLQRVTETYLTPENASTAIVTNTNNKSLAESLGLKIIEL